MTVRNGGRSANPWPASFVFWRLLGSEQKSTKGALVHTAQSNGGTQAAEGRRWGGVTAALGVHPRVEPGANGK